ncbi:hypothetical protein LTS18_005117, partial [Coniosporium uncinatum]
MDDLSGLDWSSTTQNTTAPTAMKANYNYPSLRPTPSPSLSGRTTPLSAQPSGNIARITANVKPPQSKGSTPVNDSFSGLLSLNSSKTTNNLTLQARQKQLLEEKARQQAEQQKRHDAQYGAQNAAFWDSVDKGKAAPQQSRNPFAPTTQPQNGTPGISAPKNNPFSALNTQQPPRTQPSESEADILAAFDSNAPVDKSSHFPIPEPALSGRSTPARTFGNGNLEAPAAPNNAFDDDDDPFGLGQ